jgi:hypothetical protein
MGRLFETGSSTSLCRDGTDAALLGGHFQLARPGGLSYRPSTVLSQYRVYAVRRRFARTVLSPRLQLGLYPQLAPLGLATGIKPRALQVVRNGEKQIRRPVPCPRNECVEDIERCHRLRMRPHVETWSGKPGSCAHHARLAANGDHVGHPCNLRAIGQGSTFGDVIGRTTLDPTGKLPAPSAPLFLSFRYRRTKFARLR